MENEMESVISPKVSIIMPVYNGDEYIQEAIDSIIAQTFTDWEFLIINEFGSNDRVTEILHEYEKQDSRIIVIQNKEKLGISASMNVGLDIANGEYIARMDSDDISASDRFEKQIAYLDSHPKIGLLGIKPQIFGEEEWEWKAECDSDQIKADSLFYLPCLHPTVMIRKRILDENAFRYNPDYPCTEDYDLFERILQYTQASNLLDQRLFKYRRYATAATYSHGNKGNEIYKEVMNRAFQRLKLQFTADELNLLCIHTSFYELTGKNVEKALINLDLLLKKIFFANEKYQIYNREKLFYTLHKRYKEAVDSLSWRCKKYDTNKIAMWYEISIFSNSEFYKANNENYDPIVSVIMPTFNSEDYVADTIWSILNQTFHDFEFLILNEYGSNDNTVLIAKSFRDSRIKIIQNTKKLGLAESLNKGLKIANGKYIARVDADDLYDSSRFEKQVKFLDEHLEYSVCGTWQHHFGLDVDKNHCPSTSHEDLKAELIFNCELCHSTVMLRKDAFISNNLLYDGSKFAEDYELWTRAITRLKFTNLPEILGQYRVRDKNITVGKLEKLQKESGEIAAAIIKRDFEIVIPTEHVTYMGGWKNEFVNNEDSNLRKKIIDFEMKLLDEMLKKNKKLNNYAQDSLEKTIERRKSWMNPMSPVNVVKVLQKQKGNRKIFLKKGIKRLLRPCLKIRTILLKPVQQQLWDMNGHMSDLDGHMLDYFEKIIHVVDTQQQQIAQLEQKINHQKESMLEIEKIILQKENDIEENINIRISKAENFIFQKTDTRILETEKLINQAIEARVQKAEENISQTMDARIWKAEEALYEAGKKIRGDIWNLSFNLEEKKNSKEIQNNFRYNELFYTDNRFESYLSAYHVLKKLLPQIKPQSVCDLGCGTGTWLYIANKMGVKDIVGFDGDYVDRNWLMIPQEYFIPADLSKQIKFTQKYDLAFSLEVAEHIDAYYADVFVSNLCAASDLVLFSAAHPGQGGDGHVNEQPEEYWENKFGQHGFEKIEIRNLFKENRDICWWYRDNICLYRKNK